MTMPGFNWPLFGRRKQAEKPVRQVVLPPFHPIIFANGRDDDTEGLKAFWENRPVTLRGIEISPGEAFVLKGLELRLSCAAFRFNVHGRHVAVIGYGGCAALGFGRMVDVDASHQATRTLSHCNLAFNCPVEP